MVWTGHINHQHALHRTAMHSRKRNFRAYKKWNKRCLQLKDADQLVIEDLAWPWSLRKEGSPHLPPARSVSATFRINLACTGYHKIKSRFCCTAGIIWQKPVVNENGEAISTKLQIGRCIMWKEDTRFCLR